VYWNREAAFRSKGLYEGTPQVPSKPPFFRRPG
jgi:hypothetical protein